MGQQKSLIVVVGVCASGKTTLSSGLRHLGYHVRSFAQEHSVSGRLWQRLEPDFLIMLDCSYETIQNRKRISWGLDRYGQQRKLLSHAREHADLIVETDRFSAGDLVDFVDKQLIEWGMGDFRECKNQ